MTTNQERRLVSRKKSPTSNAWSYVYEGTCLAPTLRLFVRLGLFLVFKATAPTKKRFRKKKHRKKKERETLTDTSKMKKRIAFGQGIRQHGIQTVKNKRVKGKRKHTHRKSKTRVWVNEA